MYLNSFELNMFYPVMLISMYLIELGHLVYIFRTYWQHAWLTVNIRKT